MKYLEFDGTYGRLGNHFYWLLLANILGNRLNEDIKILKNKAYYDFKLQDAYNTLNIEQFAKDRNELVANDIIYKNIDHPIQRYRQRFNVDFTLNDIENFVEKTFLKSNIYQDIANLNTFYIDCVAMHIRNGDYVNDYSLDIFNRSEYISNAILFIPNNINALVVYSDDNDLNQQLYHNILKKRFLNITYVKNTSGLDDFINFSKYKHKILWNSTFSYWAAFIGNVIHKHSYRNVIAPSRFGRTDPIADHLNPLWTIIEV